MKISVTTMILWMFGTSCSTSRRVACAAFTSKSEIPMTHRRVSPSGVRHLSATVESPTAANNNNQEDDNNSAAPSSNKMPDMDEIVSLCKRRGIIFPSSEIYNGYAGFYDYGPLGAELKKNIKDAWWRNFVTQREDVVGLDSSIIHNPTTWKSSGMFVLCSLGRRNMRFLPSLLGTTRPNKSSIAVSHISLSTSHVFSQVIWMGFRIPWWIVRKPSLDFARINCFTRPSS